jgi:ATP-dependent Zn protease
MDELCAQLLDRARQTVREHQDKVEALVERLLEVEELDAEAAAAILGERSGQEALPETGP